MVGKINVNWVAYAYTCKLVFNSDNCGQSSRSKGHTVVFTHDWSLQLSTWCSSEQAHPTLDVGTRKVMSYVQPIFPSILLRYGQRRNPWETPYLTSHQGQRTQRWSEQLCPTSIFRRFAHMDRRTTYQALASSATEPKGTILAFCHGESPFELRLLIKQKARIFCASHLWWYPCKILFGVWEIPRWLVGASTPHSRWRQEEGMSYAQVMFPGSLLRYGRRRSPWETPPPNWSLEP
jgi:hypothetical protein